MICVDSRRAKAKLLDSYLISMEAQAGVAWLFSTSATYVTLSPESMSKGPDCLAASTRCGSTKSRRRVVDGCCAVTVREATSAS